MTDDSDDDNIVRATLRAVVDRMIPADDFPSGWEAGVGDFLARVFRTDQRDRWPAVRMVLVALDDAARRSHGRGFAAVPPAEQDALIRAAERGALTGAATAEQQSRAVRLLADLSAEGYYGDPGNGGNRHMAGWRMIGYLPGAGGDRWTDQ